MTNWCLSICQISCCWKPWLEAHLNSVSSHAHNGSHCCTAEIKDVWYVLFRRLISTSAFIVTKLTWSDAWMQPQTWFIQLLWLHSLWNMQRSLWFEESAIFAYDQLNDICLAMEVSLLDRPWHVASHYLSHRIHTGCWKLLHQIFWQSWCWTLIFWTQRNVVHHCKSITRY